MKKISVKIFSAKKRIIIFVVIILGLLIASQWWSIRMVYAGKFNQDTAFFFAKVYRLNAGNVWTGNKKINISLATYLSDEQFAFDYLRKQAKTKGEELNMSEEQMKDIAWDKVLRQAWVDNLATNNKVQISDQDFEDFYTSIGGKEDLEQSLKNAGIDFGQYKKFVIKPSIIEARVYKYLLDNFNDLEGMQKAQNAYKALVDDHQKFEDVAQEFSDDMTYVNDSMFVSVEELGEFGEPIQALKAGEYSKIMVLPGNPGYYVIWLLKGTSVDDATQKEIKELRGIAIRAKSMEDFYADWKNNSQINKWYK